MHFLLDHGAVHISQQHLLARPFGRGDHQIDAHPLDIRAQTFPNDCQASAFMSSARALVRSQPKRHPRPPCISNSIEPKTPQLRALGEVNRSHYAWGRSVRVNQSGRICACFTEVSTPVSGSRAGQGVKQEAVRCRRARLTPQPSCYKNIETKRKNVRYILKLRRNRDYP